MSSCDRPALETSLRALQTQLTDMRGRLGALDGERAALVRQSAAASQERDFWKSEAERLSALAAAKEAVLERYAQALALREPPDASAHLGDCSAGASRLPGVEQALALREAELAAALPSVDEAERLSEETARLHTELDEQRHATKRAEASNAPLQAKLDDCLRRQKDLRDQLGKSELERQRQMSAYQAELTNASKRLRASKSQNELLTRKFQEAQQPLQQPPPPAPPAFQQRSSSNALFGRDARRTL